MGTDRGESNSWRWHSCGQLPHAHSSLFAAASEVLIRHLQTDPSCDAASSEQIPALQTDCLVGVTGCGAAVCTLRKTKALQAASLRNAYSLVTLESLSLHAKAR